MKNYTSLSSSPNTNYIQFNPDLQRQQSEQSVERENGRSGSQSIYTYEDIINIKNMGMEVKELQTIVLPFYIPIIDIVISNDLSIEIVDHSSIETKERILCSGRIRKYRLNGIVKNYDIFIEMENGSVFHVKKRGIMMRTRVSEDLRRHIIKTMVNYVADGSDVDSKMNSSCSSYSSSSSSLGGGGGGGVGGDGGGGIVQDIHTPLLREKEVKPKKGCLGFLACFRG
jgi:uncharacterized membrane protein YgcG